jgi:hypothetical protein
VSLPVAVAHFCTAKCRVPARYPYHDHYHYLGGRWFLRLRDEAVPVLDQRGALEVELRRLGLALVEPLGVRIVLAFVRVVGARLLS